MKLIKLSAVALCIAALSACTNDDPILLGKDTEAVCPDAAGNGGDYRGFYLLNEGNMGSNKCTLDYFDYGTATYVRNIYSERNPNVVLELGDTGNDMAVYNGRLYIVVNGSHKVEVLDAYTATRIGQVDISSPREIAFANGKAFVTSSVGGDADKGSVVRFDLETLKVEATASVGYFPEDIILHEGKLFVANSYNYNAGLFDNTVTVLNPSTLAVEYTISTNAVNLQKIVVDQLDRMWINTLGNYYDIAAQIICLSKNSNGRYEQTDLTADFNAGDMLFYNDKLSFFASSYDENWNATFSYTSILTGNSTGSVSLQNFTPSNADAIQTPYCLAVNSSTGDYLMTDAKNYTSSGSVYCYDSNWKLKWSATTGDIPGHIAFVNK